MSYHLPIVITCNLLFKGLFYQDKIDGLCDDVHSTETSSAMVVLDDHPSSSTATTSHQSDYAAANDDVSTSYRYEKVISCL